MGKVFFVSGIDTDCGKTYITGLLAKSIRDKRKQVITQKLVQTGCEGIADDILEHRRLMGIELFPEDTSGITNPYVFKFPASPHLSAEMENISIDIDVLASTTKQLENSYEITLVEGAGGLCVPLTKSVLFIDYIVQQKHPLILVTSSKLGSINHTILSLELCKQKNIEIAIVIYNVFPDSNIQIAESSFIFLSEYIANNFPQTKLYLDSEIGTIELQ